MPLSERERGIKVEVVGDVWDGLELGKVAKPEMDETSVEGDKIPAVFPMGLWMGNVPFSKEKEGRIGAYGW